MAPWQFWFFLAATMIRQIPHLYLEWKMRNVKKKILSGRSSTIFMYMIYLIIWLICLVLACCGTYKNVFFIIGGLILMTGIIIRFAGIFSLGKYFSSQITICEKHALVTNGIYSFVRHPIHLALLIELLGMIIFVGAWWLTLFLLILIGVIIRRNKFEDSTLTQIFGATAITYQNRVPAMNIITGLIRYARRKNITKKE